jgi:hypothetical protein
MNEFDNDNEANRDHALSYDLKGRQSVRATFRLSTGSISAISIVAGQLGIKQKSIFDYLVEDIENLQSIARRLGEDFMTQKSDRVQKTFVVSRRSLSSLELVASRFNTPRDALVEISVQRLLPIIARERKKHVLRKTMLAQIEAFHRTGKHLADKLQTQLGAEDPMADHFKQAMLAVNNASSQIRELIEKGEALEMLDEQFSARTADEQLD